MRYLIGLLLIIGALWVGKQILTEWERVKAKKDVEDGREPATQNQSTPAVLPGLPASLESSLQTAQKQGAASLKTWLKNYRSYVTDPRLAAIELDYVVLVSQGNPQEAKQIFAAIKQRTPTNSLVYPRIKQLEKTYQ
jgi:hypothetical protein